MFIGYVFVDVNSISSQAVSMRLFLCWYCWNVAAIVGCRHLYRVTQSCQATLHERIELSLNGVSLFSFAWRRKFIHIPSNYGKYVMRISIQKRFAFSEFLTRITS